MGHRCNMGRRRNPGLGLRHELLPLHVPCGILPREVRRARERRRRCGSEAPFGRLQCRRGLLRQRVGLAARTYARLVQRSPDMQLFVEDGLVVLRAPGSADLVVRLAIVGQKLLEARLGYGRLIVGRDGTRRWRAQRGCLRHCWCAQQAGGMRVKPRPVVGEPPRLRLPKEAYLLARQAPQAHSAICRRRDQPFHTLEVLNPHDGTQVGTPREEDLDVRA
mmetsp:Transcript_49332/g.136769  ORF Transcript_49332/g.136769 Transcript_49332/m.136769 type:complete len:220 (-) Transcript_49332:62-721(-)